MPGLVAVPLGSLPTLWYPVGLVWRPARHDGKWLAGSIPAAGHGQGRNVERAGAPVIGVTAGETACPAGTESHRREPGPVARPGAGHGGCAA